MIIIYMLLLLFLVNLSPTNAEQTFVGLSPNQNIQTLPGRFLNEIFFHLLDFVALLFCYLYSFSSVFF